MPEKLTAKRIGQAGRATASSTAGADPPSAAPQVSRAAAPAAEAVAPAGGDDRTRRIATAAYLRAESRGFAGGSAEQDWLEAEAEVDRALQAGA